MVKIQKGTIYNVVTMEQYEEQYKRYGWEIVKEATEQKQDIPIDLLQSEIEVQNYIKMRAKRAKVFNDGLLQKEG